MKASPFKRYKKSVTIIIIRTVFTTAVFADTKERDLVTTADIRTPEPEVVSLS